MSHADSSSVGQTSSNIADVAVVGAGAVGLATAMALATSGQRVVVIEAEAKVASHQTGNNSGVIHSGLYYKPGSLKATLCTAGRDLMYEFCAKHGIAHERCGKIVVALSEDQTPALDELQRRGTANGLRGLRRLGPSELREHEPHVAGVAGLYVEETGIDAIAAVHVAAVVAIAPTPGAAWALAYAGCDRVVIEEQELAGAVSPLPVEALRIENETASVLRQLGIDTLGQLLRIPRETLPARFGEALLRRLDQALGRTLEPLVPLRYCQPIYAAIEFDGEVESFEVLDMAVKQLLLEQIIPELLRRGLGARRVEVEFRRSYTPPIKNVVVLSRPTRNATGMFKLISLATEALRSEEGFVGVSMSIPALERLTDEQATLTEQEEHVREVELNHLIDRLHARFGEGVFVQPQLVEAHVPERACTVVVPRSVCSSTPARIATGRNDRPPRLLTQPVEVGVIASPSVEGDGPPVSLTLDGEVHRVVYAIGPERIEGRWWDGHGKTRDYFEVEDAEAARFWMFRVLQTGKWYVRVMF